MYVDMRRVVGKAQRALPSPSGSGCGVSPFDSTFQSSGATTEKVKTDFRSGCSNVV